MSDAEAVATFKRWQELVPRVVLDNSFQFALRNYAHHNSSSEGVVWALLGAVDRLSGAPEGRS